MEDAVQMSKMITGAWVSQLVYVIAKLKIADLIAEEPKTAEEVAGLTDTQPDMMSRFLRAAASVGLFAENDEHQFESTPLAETLRSDLPHSQWALAIMMGEEHYRCWGELLYSLETGKKSFDKLYGQPVFEYLGEHPEAAKIFDAAMTSVHGRESLPMAKAYDFSQFGSLVDIGGGNGSLLATILGEHGSVNGAIYDLPNVIKRTRESLASSPVADRIELISGSFFESAPEGYDCYLMRHIIHDWTDEECGIILQNCHAAMPDGAKLLVAESVIPPGNEPFFGKLLDLTMMLIPGGKERTEEEYRKLFAENGFTLTQVVPTETEVSFVEAVKA
ncbi:MAG: methyltransferase [Planctomycetaceae bacterium]|nr:methyltransferase [Planctomycetaceae bacterium]